MKPSVLILAAGKSTRISALANGLPKPLLRIGGETLLGWNLRWVQSYGFDDVWINTHYRADDIHEAVGDGSRYGMNV